MDGVTLATHQGYAPLPGLPDPGPSAHQCLLSGEGLPKALGAQPWEARQEPGLGGLPPSSSPAL